MPDVLVESAFPDRVFQPYVPMDTARMRAYLARYDSYLESRPCSHPIIGGPMSILSFLESVGVRYGVNPMALVVYGQAEQSTFSRSVARVVTMKATTHKWQEDGKDKTGSLLEYAERFACGYGAYESGFSSHWAGFEMQFVSLGEYIGRKMASYSDPNVLKQPIVVDGKIVVPLTRATRIQLRYTPHAAAILERRQIFAAMAPELLT